MSFYTRAKKISPRWFKRIYRRVRKRVKKFVRKICKFLYVRFYKYVKTDPKMVLMLSFHGRGYSDNPRAIYEYMLKDPRWEGYKFIWAIKKPRKKKLQIPGCTIVEYLGVRYFWYLCRAKFWIFNCKMPVYIRKKEDQVYLQTWHGTPLKRLAHDIDVAEDATFYRSEVTFERMANSYDLDVARYNYMISPNAFCTDVFQSAFRINKERLIETGYPRNDFITNTTPEEVIALKEKYKIPLDKKVLLYAPTWRDNSYDDKGYTFELQADFKKWKSILGDDWVLVFKPHYLIHTKFDTDEELEGFLYKIPASKEINELYVLADAMVTDYSSVFFDYAILKRPIYFYMYDLDEYANDLRGFYLDIHKDLPGKIYMNEEEMLKNIKNGSYDYSKLTEFNKRFNNHEDGHASERVVDILSKDQ